MMSDSETLQRLIRTCRLYVYDERAGHSCEHGWRHPCPMYSGTEESCVDYETEVD